MGTCMSRPVIEDVDIESDAGDQYTLNTVIIHRNSSQPVEFPNAKTHPPKSDCLPFPDTVKLALSAKDSSLADLSYSPNLQAEQMNNENDMPQETTSLARKLKELTLRNKAKRKTRNSDLFGLKVIPNLNTTVMTQPLQELSSSYGNESPIKEISRGNAIEEHLIPSKETTVHIPERLTDTVRVSNQGTKLPILQPQNSLTSLFHPREELERPGIKVYNRSVESFCDYPKLTDKRNMSHLKRCKTEGSLTTSNSIPLVISKIVSIGSQLFYDRGSSKKDDLSETTISECSPGPIGDTQFKDEVPRNAPVSPYDEFLNNPTEFTCRDCNSSI
ncbi:BA75_02898T0 [Komagataella pastoris]|uniref:BA75_02898T0 n=1 Tax=Komagataella pastoris TaxID=4922 RepID=A0A1B2JC22_PICPA|nr:BA75_02898T0 [Komagataella pastoris]